jgi:chromatin segregation and condensation protein Rec8/ScpA/Scc1 (kleisin family)
MDPVDEYARLKAEIRRLQDRAEVLRESFLRPAARLRSNRFEIVIKRQKRRLFQKDRLPAAMLADPRFWEERESEVVTCHEITGVNGTDEDIVLIE